MLNYLSVYVIAFLVFGMIGYCDQDNPVSNSNKSGGPSASGIREGVKGRVTASDGRPIADAFIEPKSLDEPAQAVPELAVTTDENGRYEWRLLPGDYLISVSAEGYQAASKKVTVEAQRAVTLDFKLERAP